MEMYGCSASTHSFVLFTNHTQSLSPPRGDVIGLSSCFQRYAGLSLAQQTIDTFQQVVLATGSFGAFLPVRLTVIKAQSYVPP